MTHSFEEHVGEVRLCVKAPSLAGLFEEAAAAICELIAGDGASLARAGTEHVSVRAFDREALLVAWLNEIVYRSEVGKVVFPAAHVESVGDRVLEATLERAEPNAILVPVKAATMHDVRVATTAEGWTAQVVLDV